jgi:hypothetical protein
VWIEPTTEGLYEVTSRNYSLSMAQTHSFPSKKSTALDAIGEIDRVWLTERLAEYRDLLDYLHAN